MARNRNRSSSSSSSRAPDTAPAASDRDHAPTDPPEPGAQDEGTPEADSPQISETQPSETPAAPTNPPQGEGEGEGEGEGQGQAVTTQPETDTQQPAPAAQETTSPPPPPPTAPTIESGPVEGAPPATTTETFDGPVAINSEAAISAPAPSPAPAPANAPDATGGAERATEERATDDPSIDDVLRDLAGGGGEPEAGYRSRSVETRLTSEQAELQSRIYRALERRGRRLRRPGDVYGWLLDQVATALNA